MKLSQLLLMRICCLSAPIMWTLCVTRVDDEDYFYKLILPVLVTSTFACFFNEKSTIQVACVLTISYVYTNLKYMDFQNGYNPVTADVFYINTNWSKIVKCLVHDLASVLKILRNVVIRFLKRYGNIRVFLFFLVCLIQAILLVYALHHFWEFVRNIQRSHLDLFVKKPFVELYSDMEFGNKPLPPLKPGDRMLTANFTNYEVKYRRNDGSLVYRDGKPVFIPYGDPIYHYRQGGDIQLKEQCEFEIFRYIGEDVLFNCSWDVRYSVLSSLEEATNFSWTYTHNGRKLVQSERHRVKQTVVLKELLKNYTSLPSKLHIMHLQDSDFGEYQLWAKVKQIVYSPFERSNSNLCWEEKIPSKSVQRYLIARFFLRKKKVHSYTVHVPVGGIVFLQNIYIHLLANESDINVLHKVDNSLTDSSDQWDTDRLCNDKLFHGCSLYTYIYYSLFRRYGHPDMNHINTFREPEPHGNNTIRLLSVSCVCAQSYGEHSFVIQREFFNRTSKKWTILEMEAPYKFIILPGNWMFSFTNYTVYENLGDLSDDTYWKRLVSVILDDEEATWKQRVFIEYCLTFIFTSEIIMLLLIITKVYNRVVILPLRNLILDGYLFFPQLEIQRDTLGEVVDGQGPHLYDTMVVNCDADKEWTHQTILPVLEVVGHVVCFPNRDFVPGDIVLRAYSEAVSTSLNFVIICSPDFIRDGLRNKCVLGQILHRYYNTKSPELKILLIKYKQCEIPGMFLLDQNVQMIDWTTHLSKESKHRQLSRWAVDQTATTSPSTCKKIFLRILYILNLNIGLFLQVFQPFSNR